MNYANELSIQYFKDTKQAFVDAFSDASKAPAEPGTAAELEIYNRARLAAAETLVAQQQGSAMQAFEAYYGGITDAGQLYRYDLASHQNRYGEKVKPINLRPLPRTEAQNHTYLLAVAQATLVAQVDDALKRNVSVDPSELQVDVATAKNGVAGDAQYALDLLHYVDGVRGARKSLIGLPTGSPAYEKYKDMVPKTDPASRIVMSNNTDPLLQAYQMLTGTIQNTHLKQTVLIQETYDAQKPGHRGLADGKLYQSLFPNGKHPGQAAIQQGLLQAYNAGDQAKVAVYTLALELYDQRAAAFQKGDYVNSNLFYTDRSAVYVPVTFHTLQDLTHDAEERIGQMQGQEGHAQPGDAQGEKAPAVQRAKPEETTQRYQPTTPQVDAASGSYTVQRGDWLTSIAAQCPTELRDATREGLGDGATDKDVMIALALTIARVNGIEDADRLKVGTSLKLPDAGVAKLGALSLAKGIYSDHQFAYRTEIQGQQVSALVDVTQSPTQLADTVPSSVTTDGQDAELPEGAPAVTNVSPDRSGVKDITPA